MTALEQLTAWIGRELGTSSWMTIDQDRVDTFADATEDDQWIHIDPDRARSGPCGATIAHGCLALSLTVPLSGQVGLPVDPPPRMTINYGLEKVRFPAPVLVGSRVRARVEMIDVVQAGDALQVVRRVTVEIEDETKPAMVAEAVSRLYF